MLFKIKQKHALGFKIWLVKLGYTRKDLADGGATFSGKGAKKSLAYVFLGFDLAGNSACQILYEEYVQHLRSSMGELVVPGAVA